MDPQQQALRILFAKHFKTALSKIEHHRGYAIDDRAAAEGAALALGYRDEMLANGGRFDLDELAKIIDEISQDLSGLKQNRPPPEPEEPKAWRDEQTGEYALNPFKKESLDLASQAAVQKSDPLLAAHLKRIAEHGLSYKYMDDQRKEREAREKIRAITYGERQHNPQVNPFLLPPGKEALQRQSEFVRANEQTPHIVNWYKQEAETPISLGFDKQTPRHLIASKNPVIGKIYERARQLHHQFLREHIEHLRQLTGEHTAQIAAAEKQLAAK